MFLDENIILVKVRLHLSQSLYKREGQKTIFRRKVSLFQILWWILFPYKEQNAILLKKYHVSEKKLSQELWTSVTPKLDQLVPYMWGPSDPILEGGVWKYFWS